MHIVNIMFSSIAGGIEQAFVDYCEGMRARGHKITAITHPDAVINAPLRAIGINPITMRNMGEWDPIAIMRLRKIILGLNPDIAIAHTTRSFTLTKFAIQKKYPLVGIAHNYNERIKRLRHADAVFTTTHDLIRFVGSLGVAEERIFHIPNMVRCYELPHRGSRNNPPVIGTMGRFVAKKGFDVYIEALKLLKEKGYQFTALLGGIGEEEKQLKKLVKAAGLKDIITFPGWVEDKRGFYTHIDIFVLPSLDEPFGIVLLEAFINGTPVVATDTSGPLDITTPNFDALLVKTGSAEDLALGMAKLLDDPHLAGSLATNAFVKAKTIYSIEGVCERIEKALLVILSEAQRSRRN